MQVIPCTHDGCPAMEKLQTDGKDLLGLSVRVTDEMKAAAVALDMRAGSLSIHDSFVLHGSDANRSGRRRAAFTMLYAKPKTVTVDAAKHWVPVYLVRGEGGAGAAQFLDIRPGESLPAE